MEELDFGIAPPAPLAELMRPKTLDEVVGQDGLLSSGGRLRLMLAQGNLGAVILWGPPGTGKTTIARLLAGAAEMVFEPSSAVFDGVLNFEKFLPVPKSGDTPDNAPCYLSTRCIVSTKPNKTDYCHGSRMAP